jgi:hypothetical protein
MILTEDFQGLISANPGGMKWTPVMIVKIIETRQDTVEGMSRLLIC